MNTTACQGHWCFWERGSSRALAGLQEGCLWVEHREDAFPKARACLDFLASCSLSWDTSGEKGSPGLHSSLHSFESVFVMSVRREAVGRHARFLLHSAVSQRVLPLLTSQSNYCRQRLLCFQCWREQKQVDNHMWVIIRRERFITPQNGNLWWKWPFSWGPLIICIPVSRETLTDEWKELLEPSWALLWAHYVEFIAEGSKLKYQFNF